MVPDDRLAAFLRIPSVSADPARADDVRRAGEWVADYVGRLGGKAGVVESGRLVVGELPSSRPGAPTVLAYGHYDVQPPDPLELWESDPFEPVARDGWLYARGVADDKGQLWMQLRAAEELVRGGGLPVNLRVVCDGEEESAGDSIVRFLERDERGADAAVVFDGWMKRWGHPEICTATRGVLAADVELRTGDRDLHSGHYGGTALNAIHALAQTLVAVFPREDGRLPKPLCEGVVRPDADELESWTRPSPGDEELRRVGARPLDPRAADEFYVRAWAEPSLDVTAILGGKPGLRNTTLVSRASALVTVRLVPDQDVATVGAALERLLREAAPDGTELDIRWEGTPPGILPADERVQGAALEALERAFGRRPLLVRSGGTLPIVPALAAAGIPSILAGMATPDCNTHSPNERMPLEAFDVGVRAARELYLALGELR